MPEQIVLKVGKKEPDQIIENFISYQIDPTFIPLPMPFTWSWPIRKRISQRVCVATFSLTVNGS
jgi:hypothetical protein